MITRLVSYHYIDRLTLTCKHCSLFHTVKMRALYVVVLFWAVDAAASLCRPSSPSHSSSAPLPSSSSVVPSSSSVVPSSSSSSSGPAPSQSHVCGGQLIPGSDYDLIDNTRNDWTFSASNGATTEAVGCLQWQQGCATVDGSTASAPYTYTISYSTPPSTLTAGTSYRFFFEFGGYPTLVGKPLVCTADNSVGPASASFAIHQAYSDNPNLVLFDFVSTYTDATITCTIQNLPTLSYWIIYGFSLEQLC